MNLKRDVLKFIDDTISYVQLLKKIVVSICLVPCKSKLLFLCCIVCQMRNHVKRVAPLLNGIIKDLRNKFLYVCDK